MVSLTPEKLPNIKGDLVRIDLEWGPGGSLNLMKRFAFGHKGIRWIPSKQKSRIPTGNVRNTIAPFQPSKEKVNFASAFIDTQTTTGHLTATQFKLQLNEDNSWQRKGYVLIALACTNRMNVKASRVAAWLHKLW